MRIPWERRMSETGVESGDTGTDVTSSEPGTGTDPEDQEAEGLLAGMAGSETADLQRQLDHWKAQARKHEGRAKANAAAATRLQEIEDSNKTELEKAQSAQRAAEEARDLALHTHSRVMAAAAHSLPVELIDHLGSGTDEEINDTAELFFRVIETRAQEIAQEIISGRNGTSPGTGPGRPVESLRPGSAPASGATPTTPDEWFRKLVTGQ